MGEGVRRAVLGVVVAVAISGEAGTQTPARSFYTGNELYGYCTNPNTLLICQAYVTGISDALTSTTVGVPVSIAGWRACIPVSVTVGQIRDVTIKWLRDNPQDRHYAAASVVAEALAKAFPCR